MSRSPRLPRPLAAAVVGTLLAAIAPALTPVAQAAYESDYAARTTVTFGENVHASMPVTLELPPPASGGAITAVTMTWDEVVPQVPLETRNTTEVRRRLDTSGCTAASTCTVDAVLPTARMANGKPTVSFAVSDGDGLISLFSRSASLENPKPTVEFLTPQDDEALWGQVTLSARAAASPVAGAAPLTGVRFYVEPGWGQETPYLFDATAPYSVTLPATDIAPVLSSRDLVVVAEDADGNLSQMPVQAKASTARRSVTVGPSPRASWTTPRVGGVIAGSMSLGVALDFHAELPDTVPARPGNPSDPHITGYDVALDGDIVASSEWTEPTSWNNYRAKKKLRAIDGWWVVGTESGLTPGRHVVTVRVRTSYGAVTTLTSRAMVADGLTWGQVRSGGRVVHDGHWVTAGTLHRFTVPVATRVPGTRLTGVGARTDSQNLLYAEWPCAADPASCPEATTVHTDEWGVPNKPGRSVLTFSANAAGDRTETLTRTIRIQPAARLSSRLSTRSVLPGRAVRFVGRLTRLDTGSPEAGRTVRLQWRKPNNLRWFTVATRATGRDGRIRFRHRPTANGFYRLHSPQVLGQIGPGMSIERKVHLRR